MNTPPSGPQEAPSPPAAEPAARPRPTSRRRWLWRALFVLAALALALVLGRNRFVGPFVLERLQPRLEAVLGGRLEVNAWRGSWWRDLTLEGVRFVPSGGREPAALRALAAPRLSARYDLPALLRGDLAGLTSLEVELEQLVLDATALPASPEDPNAEPFELPARLPQLALQLQRVEVLLAKDGLELHELSLRSDGHALELAAAHLAAGALLPPPLNGALELRGRWRDANLWIESGRWGDALQLGAGWLGFGSAPAASGAAFAKLDQEAPEPKSPLDRLHARLGLELLPATDPLADRNGRLDLALRWDAAGGASGLALRAQTTRLDLARVQPFLPPSVDAFHGALSLELEATLDPERPRLAETSIDLRGSDVSWGEHSVSACRLRARSAEGVLAVETLELETSTPDETINRLTADALTLPLDAPSLRALLADASGRARLELDDLAGLLASAGLETSAAPPPHRLELGLRLGDDAVELSEGRAIAGDGSLTLSRGTLRFAPHDDDDPEAWWRAAELDLDLALEVPRLDAFAQAFALPGRAATLGGALDGTVRLAGPLTALRGEAQVEAKGLQLDGQALGDLTLDARVAGTEVTLDRLRLEAFEGTAIASGAFDLAAHSASGVRVELALDDAAALQARFGSAGEPLEGTARGVLTLDGPLERADGSLELTADALRYGSLPPLDVAASGTFAGGTLTVETLNARLDELTLEARGTVHELLRLANRDEDSPAPRLDVTLDALRLSRQDADLALRAAAEFALEGEGVLRVDPLAFEGSAGRVLVEGARTGSDASLSLVLEDFEPFPLLLPMGRAPEAFAFEAEPVRGNLQLRFTRDEDGAGVLTGTTQLALRGLLLEPGAPLLDLTLDASLDPQRLVLRELTAGAPLREGSGIGRLRLEGSLPLRPLAASPLGEGPLELALEAETQALELWPRALREQVFGARLGVRGRLTAEGALTGTTTRPRGRLAVRSDALELEDLVTGEVLAPVDLTAEATLADTATALGRLHLAEVASVDLQAELGAALDLRALLDGSLAWDELPLWASAEADLPDLQRLAGRLEGVRRLEGALHAELVLDGAGDGRTLRGSAEVERLALRLPSAFPALQDVSGSLRFEGDAATLEGLTGRLGGAEFLLRGTAADLFAAAGPQLDLHLRGDDLLLTRSVTTRVRADTDLSLSGRPAALRLAGEVALTDGRWGAPIDLLSGLTGETTAPAAGRGLDLALARSGPLADLDLDLRVTGRESFALENNLISGGLRPELHVGGTGAVPLLDGSVFLDPTVLSLPSGGLRIDSGRVAFDEADPFVPELSLVGGMRLKGYDVLVQVGGPYDDPTVRLSSTPPLPNQDLLVLFLTGQLPEGSSTERSRGAAESVAVYLAQDYLSRWLSGPGESDRESVLSRIDLSIGDDLTRSGALTTEVTYLLSERLSGPGVERYLRGERDVYDRINFGYGLRFRFR